MVALAPCSSAEAAIARRIRFHQLKRSKENVHYEDIAQITFQTRLPKWFNKRPSRFQNHSAGGMTKFESFLIYTFICQKIVAKHFIKVIFFFS